MNTPTPPPSNPSAVAASGSSSLSPGGGARGPGVFVSLSLLLAVAGLALGFYLVHQTNDLERRLDQDSTESLARDQRAADRDRRLGELERQWTQAQGEADVAAGQITDADLRRRRDMLALIDIERIVEQAQLQLRLGTPASAAIDALAAADARLGRLGSARALRVQVALRHDLARLRAAPDIDRGALAARLDPLLAAVDGWHVSADATHPTSAPLSPAAATQRGAEHANESANDSVGARLRAWIAREFGDLLRIREVDTPQALLLGPTQQQLLRDRVRLGVLDLRQAILARDERTVRSEEAALEVLLQRYFDPNQAAVVAALVQLRTTAMAAAPNTAPSLDETLNALRAARGGSDG